MYSVSFEKVAVTAAQDLFQLVTPDSDVKAIVHAIYISQSSDVGDAAAENLNILIHRGSTNGSGGASATPTPLYDQDTASVVVCEVNNTSQSTEGTIIHAQAFNIANGLVLEFPEACRPIITENDIFVIELQENPADELTMSGTLYFEETNRNPRRDKKVR